MFNQIIKYCFLIFFLYSLSIWAQDDSGYKYQVDGNEYSVIFHQKPSIVPSIAKDMEKLITAELLNTQELSFQRCESFLYPSGSSSQVNKELVLSFINNYATYFGLKYPDINYSENELGKIGTLHASKELEISDEEKWEMTYFAKAVFGNHSAIILYVGCLSEDYPTSEISNFLSSIKKEE